MAPHQPLIEQLFAELKARQQPDEAAVPWKDGALRVSMALRGGRAVPRVDTLAGRQARCGSDLLDEPALAQGHDYFSLGGLDVSPERTLSRLQTDTDGSERYTVHIKDLDTGELLTDRSTGTSGATVWANDNTTLFYVMLTENWQPYLVRVAPARHGRRRRSRRLRRSRAARSSSASTRRSPTRSC